MVISPRVFSGWFVHQACWFASLCGEFPGERHCQNTRFRDTVFPLLKQWRHEGMQNKKPGPVLHRPGLAREEKLPA